MTSVFQVKIGIRNMVMPGARIVMIVVMKFTAPRMVPKPDEREAEHPEVAADPGRERRARQRRVGEPAERCRTLRGEEPADGDQAAEAEQPERERVQPRERDVGRTDLQRHERVGEAGEQRRREHQQHDRAVHREQLVVLLLGLEHVEARLEQLRADDERHHAADAEVDERGDQVHVPDGLVVGGGDPADDHVALALRQCCG